MAILENNSIVNDADFLAFYLPGMAWNGSQDGGKMRTHGARLAAKLSEAGIPWTLATAKDLRATWPHAEELDADTVFVVQGDGSEKYPIKRTKVAGDMTIFRREHKKGMKGAYNGGEKYSAWVERNTKRQVGATLALTASAAIVVSLLLTPVAGAAVLAAGTAAAGALEAGEGAEALEAMADSGALSTLAEEAGVADSDMVATLEVLDAVASDAVDAVAKSATLEAEPSAEGATVAEPSAEGATVVEPSTVATSTPSSTALLERLRTSLMSARDYVVAHPGESVGAAVLTVVGLVLRKRLL